MLEYLKKEANKTVTENGAATHMVLSPPST